MSNTIEKKGTVQGKEKFGPSTLGPCIMFESNVLVHNHHFLEDPQHSVCF